MRARRLASGGAKSDEVIARTIKSILNKLTLEKFAALYQQLVTCGISKVEHVEQLIREVFEKATTQHHFIDMYADLCMQLHEFFTKNPISNDLSCGFKRVLLNVCQGSFERHLVPPNKDLDSLSSEDRELAEARYKTRMLGNIKLVGALLGMRMLAGKVLLAVVEELLRNPTPETLESLAAFLTSVGPIFDTPDWAHFETFAATFDQVRKLAEKGPFEQRIRFLLKDVLDLRANGWQDRKPKKADGPSTIDEVHKKAAEERSPHASGREPRAAAAPTPTQSAVASPVFKNPALLALEARAALKRQERLGAESASEAVCGSPSPTALVDGDPWQ